MNSYESEGVPFHELLKSVARVSGIRRVRFTSPHPNDVTQELLEVMAQEPSVCEQLHLPVQSGNDKVLRRMLRRYSVKTFLDKVRLARELIPDLSLSTDIIVAFPGETESQFEDTLNLLREVRFDDAYAYKYSLRDGTPATRLPKSDFLSEGEAQMRLARLIEVHRDIQNEVNKAEVGRIEEVLVEKEGRRKGQVLGRTRRNKVVAFKTSSEQIGTYQQVQLTDTTGATFLGELLN